MGATQLEPWREDIRKTLSSILDEVEKMEKIDEYKRFVPRLEEMKKRIGNLLEVLNKPFIQREQLLKQTENLQKQISHIKFQLQQGASKYSARAGL